MGMCAGIWAYAGRGAGAWEMSNCGEKKGIWAYAGGQMRGEVAREAREWDGEGWGGEGRGRAALVDGLR